MKTEAQGAATERLVSNDPDVVAIFRVSESTTASLNHRGEVTIRQLRKRAHGSGEPGTKMEIIVEEVVVKLPAADFAQIGRLVHVIRGGRDAE